MRQLPLTNAAIGSLAGVLLVAAGGYFGLVWPAGREVGRLKTQLAALSAQAAGAAQAAQPVTDVERASWQIVETQIRERFITPDDQYELLVEIAQLARASGMAVLDIQLEGAATAADPAAVTPTVTVASGPFPLALPPGLALNPGVIKLTARHQYRALVDFLDRLATGNRYVAVQGLAAR